MASRCSLWGVWVGLAAWLLVPVQASAQVREYPSPGYRVTFNLFYDGNYTDALKNYQAEWRSALRFGQMRWIDSICYHTMIGECYYQMGNLPLALENYTAAVRLFLTFPDWMISAQFAPAIRPANAAAPPWGVSTRGARLGNYPDRTPVMRGKLITQEDIAKGGRIEQASYYTINAQEIVRCTVLAIRRRAQLLGPLSKYDPLNKQLMTALQQPVGPRNHWSQAYTGVEFAVALAANGREDEAVPALTRAVVAAGEFDHPLTATALLELGRIALLQGKSDVAAKAFFEATISAYFYEDLGVMEEAFRYAALAHLLANQKGPFPPLVPAGQWAQAKNWRQLRASLLLSAAEGLLTARESAQALKMIDEAQLVMARRAMVNGAIGARLSYLRAVAMFQQGRVDLGETALAAAMNYMRLGSHWLFHIAQVDGYFLGSQITARQAIDLFENVLRDPEPMDWATDPMESLAVLTVPHPESLEHWFLASLQKTDREEAVAAALEISERARRHRFFSSLALGGRLQALRWVLEAPPESLDKRTLIQRQDLLAGYPGYQALQQQLGQIRLGLAKLPLLPQDAETARQQGEMLAALGKLSLQQEAILREIAVRREAASMVFPPLRKTADIQKTLPEGTAVLYFVAAGGTLNAFLMNRDKCTAWGVKGAGQLDRHLVAMLRGMGNYESNRELTLKELADGQWREPARKLLELLLEGSKADFAKKFPELVIVPDGILWYLPFEALQVSADGGLRPLITRCRIRYAPTLSLAVSEYRARRALPKTALVLGRLYPRESSAQGEAMYAEMAKVVPQAAVLSRAPLPAPSYLYKTQLNQLLVLDDLSPPEKGPYSWTPIQIDRARAGNTLNDWMALPWGGPEVVVLPGFHTPAESSLRRGGQAAGTDVFLSVCGLMACGGRTLLMSRWRTGGQSSVDLVREFVQELPHTTPADAWQRAVMVVADSRLNLEAEPRIKKSVNEEPPKGNHPFFWSGYMLVDSGTPPEKPEKGEPEPEPPKPKETPLPAEKKVKADAPQPEMGAEPKEASREPEAAKEPLPTPLAPAAEAAEEPAPAKGRAPKKPAASKRTKKGGIPPNMP